MAQWTLPTKVDVKSKIRTSPELLFLRKVKNFNKSRYSRNRQLARVIFYFSLYINILIIYGVFFVMYGLSFDSDFFFFMIAIIEVFLLFLFYTY